MKITQKVGLQGQFKVLSTDPVTGDLHETGWSCNQILDSATAQIFNGLAPMPTFTLGYSPTASTSAFENGYDVVPTERTDIVNTVSVVAPHRCEYTIESKFVCTPAFVESSRNINQIGIKDFNCAPVRTEVGTVINQYPVFSGQELVIMFKLTMAIELVLPASLIIRDFGGTVVSTETVSASFSQPVIPNPSIDAYNLLKGTRRAYLNVYLPNTLPPNDQLSWYDISGGYLWSGSSETYGLKNYRGVGIWVGDTTITQCKQLVFVMCDIGLAFNVIFNTPLSIPNNKFLETVWEIQWSNQ